ncbi:putative virion structural protein [Erwinia phage vB_EamM_Joad]|uniref:Putative virion structural protein n=1 Tax=Erwinia phage vB_EamM_Joad TaxID=2026081 RepID=A0A223LI26_9CAUD|nr:putative virion structural protein [Erwinia phage vB_EamM_Joad]
MTTRTVADDNPLVHYTDRALWGNPEIDHQFQVNMERLSTELGYIKNFNYMGKWRSLPKANRFYHIFTIGGLHPGFWSFREKFRTRNPLDRWVRMDDVAVVHGIQLDIYNQVGRQFPRSKAWLLATYDGLVLMALEKLVIFPIPMTDKYTFRTYNPTVIVDKFSLVTEPTANPFAYETMTYENTAELQVFQARYNALKAKPGYTGVFHNGRFVMAAPNALTLSIGDEVEIWHDPTVKEVKQYRYGDLKDFYSTLDQKRKLILHPPKSDSWIMRYFDDSDFYVVRPDKYGIYFHRNNENAVRQLTHNDLSIADDQIKMQMAPLGDLAKIEDFIILEIVRDTTWKFDWPFESQRVRYLYRLDDAGILAAMTGVRALIPEWTAAQLESGPVQQLVKSQFNKLTTAMSRDALGYNAMTRAMSDTPMKVAYQEGGRGIVVPPTYSGDFVAYEYDENGVLLEWNQFYNTQLFSPLNPACKLVEFIMGQGGRTLNYVVTNRDTQLIENVEFRILVGRWNIINNEFFGELKDVTGTDLYEVSNGYVVFKKLDVVNQRAMIVFGDQFLAYEFELQHMDHSLSFDLTEIYDDGRLPVKVVLAQLDLWLNNRPLIDNVDWFFDDGHFFIHNKEFLVEGPQKITVRAHGFHADLKKPKTETELGFVEGGVIGNIPRYNIREDRTTRCVIYGRLFHQGDVPSAELLPASNLDDSLNGRPYMVKHSYTPVKFAEKYNNHPLYDEGRDLDKRIVDYLTKYCPKPQPQVMANLQDKYRLFSPFLNQLVNGVLNKVIVLPDLEDGKIFSNQTIQELAAPFTSWLKYDPAALGFDQRYFAIMPYANVDTLTVTAKELLFIRQANDLFLKSACKIESHFEVS